MSNLKKRLARATLPLRSGLTRKGLARATRALRTGWLTSQVDQYDGLAHRLERLEQGWKIHLPAMLDAVSTTLHKAREAEASHDRIEMLREELDHMRNLVDDMAAAFAGAIQNKTSIIPSWLLVQASGHGLRLRLGQLKEPAQGWLDLQDIVGSPPIFLLRNGQRLDIEQGHIEALQIGDDVIAAWSTERLLETLEQVAPLLSVEGAIRISADDAAQGRMTEKQTKASAIRLIPETADRLLVHAASPR